MDLLHGTKIFSKIDLKSRYHQVRVKKGDITKMTFRTWYEHYKYMVMPFGVMNALAIFMDYMNNVFHPFADEFVVVFIDDILIYSRTREVHEEHLRVMLEILRETQLYGRLSKCEILLEEVKFLGHVISAEEIAMNPSKVVKISRPTTISNMFSKNFQNGQNPNFVTLLPRSTRGCDAI